jgi:hypothetical protein
VPSHGAAVGVGERDLILTGPVQLGQHRRVPFAPLPDGCNLLGEVGCPAPTDPALLGIALIQAAEVVG